MPQSVTIITSVRNCLDETKVFIESLFSHKPTNLDQVIIVDDGSEEETKDFLQSLRGNIRLIRNDKSIGFGPANNLGVEQSQSDWLLFMNNDLVLTKDWAKPFETVMNGEQKLNQLGCLGNVQLDPRTKKIDHGGITFSKGYPSHFLQGEENLPSEGFSEYLAVTGACFLIRKDLFSRVGGFDQDYKTGFEDIDLCLKLRLLGYRHYVANESKIWHKRSSTPERNDHQAHNSKVFYGRWGKIITRLEEWGRANASTSQHKKKQYAHILEKPESFLFADRDLLMQNFQFHLRNQMWKESEKVLKLLKENFGGDADLILLESQLLRKSDQPSKAKTLLTKGGDESITSSFLLEEALVTKALGEMTSARRKFLSLAKKGFIPGVCFQQIGDCYLEENKFEDAKKYYIKALVHLPDSFRIWNRLAKVHQELGDKLHEIKVLQKSFSLSPQNSSTFLTLFQSLVGIGSWTKAYQLCIRSKEMQIPTEHLLDFSKACIESGDIKSAIISLNKLISKGHDAAEAYFLKGNVMVLLKEYSRAVEYYRKALDYREDWPEALSNLHNSKTFLCDWSERKKELENLQAFHENGSILGGAFELAGLYWSEEEESKYAQIRSDKIVADTEAIRRRLNFDYNPQERTKKRIGFLSSDFRNHAVGHQIIALFENLDSEKYELFIYATSPSEDSEVRKRIENISKCFTNLSSFSLVNKAIAIHRDELDLLVDLGGFSRGHNAQLLALRPAVKQAHYLGYASSMGAEFVDYMIADELVLPSSSNKNYQENILRMQGCFFPPGDFQGFAKRVKRKEVGLPSRGIVYCAFHAAYKLDPDIWACWMRILKAVPESVLWLKFKPADDALKNLKAEAVRLGVSSKRIILAEDLPDRKAHLSRMAVADLYLDCPLYNGHASAMDALHAKLPILTVKGNRFCNRVGESFCTNLDLQEMICKDLRKYEEKAIELGLRPSKLLPLRKKIQENADAVLCPVEHTKRFEASLDAILAKPVKVTTKTRRTGQEKKQTVSKPAVLPLKDFTLVMIRPPEITNWARNISMLADELAKLGGATIVIESPTSQSKKSDFSKSVKVLFSSEESFSQAINQAICEVNSQYIFYLDDPLRVLPAAHFIETMKTAMEALHQGKVGILGVCSSIEPHTGCLVTKSADAKKQNVKVAGFFSPSFVLNLDAVQHTGGLRNFSDSMALSVLDMSLRLEGEGYRNSLIETDRIICPAHSGKEYLLQSSKSDLHRFVKLWNRKPSSLKPKYPPKDEQVGETADYQEWIRLCDTMTEADILAFRKEVDDLNHKPLISVVMPVFNPPKKFLMKAIESVISQAYENWELCIADDASTQKYIRPLLESYASEDSRIKVTFRKTNGHISVASNSAIKLATGRFVAFLDHDDELRPHSLLEVAKVINQHPDAKLIYSDEDKIDEHGARYEPYFKPDWNPDLLLGQNYISHFSVFEAALLRKLKGLRKGYEGSQDWDLTLRFTEQVEKTCILHIPKVLYHWRAMGGSTALGVKEKTNVFDVTEKAVQECLKRRQIKASVSFHEQSWNYPKIKYLALEEESPTVSILIPTRDRIDLLDKCITSIFGTIEYKNIEIIVIDNESREERSHTYLDEIKKEKRVKVLSIPGEFNYSKLNNLATEKARGEILLLLNNDIEAITKGWFEEMLSHAMRTEIGCVGAKLLYPDGRLQHGGVIVGLGGGAGHSHKFAGKGSRGYSGHLCVSRNVSAVTAACMMIRKEIYQAVGGLEESNLKVAFNDVDFCLRVEKLRYRNLWSPFAELVHHESASRGYDHSTVDKRIRSSREIVSLQNRWSLKSYDDPHYNPNLTMLSEQYWFGIKEKKKSYISGNGSKSFVAKMEISLPESQKVSLLNQMGKSHVSTKNRKREVILPILKPELGSSWNGLHFDCMPENANEIHGVVETENISQHEYDEHAIEIIESIGDRGIVLDCGSGRRPTYYSNVVNFDPVAYETTDVVGVGESLPFEDGVFDAVFSLNVLEHVRDPFTCAKEIARVLKPNGKLYCVVPFMSPYHGYPDHYYNMTKSGLHNLFKNHFHVQRQDVLDSGHPIHSITWILRNWSEGLTGSIKDQFLNKKVAELIGDPSDYFDESFVKQLTKEKEFELGATTALWGIKMQVDENIYKPSPTLEFDRNQYKETWNKLSVSFDSARLHVTGDANEKELRDSSLETITRINRYVNFDKGDTVLEIGCGIGRIGKELAPGCKKWIGCDIADNMLRHARKRLSDLDNIELVELTESNLSPIRDSSIDVVYCTVVFMHLDEWDRYEYVKEAFRVLKSGGRAYFDNFSLTTEEGWRIFKAHHEMSERPPYISKSSTREELHEYMIRSKFEDVLTEQDGVLAIVSGIKNKGIEAKTSKFIFKKNNSTKILSLHFPKTGGTSFGKILQMIYGESYMPHYPQLEEQGDEKSEIFENKSCVHGHLVLDRYVQLYEPGLFITWLRCPINRTISLYNHILKSPDATNSLHQKVITDKLSLIEFVELAMNWNQLFHWIGNRNLEDFKVIGFLETAQASIVKCAAALNWNYIPEFPWVNKTKNGNIIEVSPNEREFIRSKNKEELLWIQKAQKIFQ